VSFLILIVAYPIIMFFTVRTVVKQPDFLKKPEAKQKSQTSSRCRFGLRILSTDRGRLFTKPVEKTEIKLSRINLPTRGGHRTFPQPLACS
jgi:hypothetical protein